MIHEIASQYETEIDSIEQLNFGRINCTYLVNGNTKFILQKINELVFPDPEKIISNYLELERFFENDAEIILPPLLKTKTGKYFFRDMEQGFWKATRYFEDSETYSTLRDMDYSRQIGAFLARFHEKAARVSTNRFVPVIEKFHHTPTYYKRFREQAKKWKKESDLSEFIEFVHSHEELIFQFDREVNAGNIKPSLIHGDPKLENFLFSRKTGQLMTLIDWDTLGPGIKYHDLGDCLRSLCNLSGEDESNISKIRFDEQVFFKFMDGYKKASMQYSIQEGRYIVLGVKTISFELGLRFLTDHMAGDHYFKVSFRGENLSRAKTQFALFDSLMQQSAVLEEIICP